MSQMNVFEDFEDEWDDFTPSLQDQLFKNLEAEHHAAATNYNVCDLYFFHLYNTIVYLSFIYTTE
jgi:hypothetical protein